MNDLRIQIHDSKRKYRLARDNGWNCGHWHYDAEAAVACIKRKTTRRGQFAPV